ncbi:MAG: M2 family metallopeptidase [Gemmatimonadota bacterium]|nr:M2 family metallopeptidase [Gemmatimonadota bacterium]
MRSATMLAVSAMLAVGCVDTALRTEVDGYLATYEQEFQGLYYEWSKAEWESNTRIIDGDTTNAARTRAAREAFVRFVGSEENIDAIRSYLEQRTKLPDLQVRRLEKMLYGAGEGPQTIPEIVEARIAAETEQVEQLYGYEFTLRGRPLTPNDIDGLLRSSTDLRERQAVWEASKAVGPTLMDGILALRDLRNQTVQALGYGDFFEYQVSDYGMSTSDMLGLTERLVQQLRPLYRELHTWARYELARRYGAPVPDLIPAHWLPNRWAQDWSALVDVEGFDVDAALADKTPEWIMQQGEAFYRSLGFDALPASFWERSSLYPLPANATFKKNTHASAWHLDLDRDVRSLMSVEPNASWYETVHHELGHVYYFMSYSRPDVPLVLREGANRAYHEAIGSQIGLAASQRRFLANRGLVSADAEIDHIAQLLKEALNHVVFIPWSAGVMTRFERTLYQDSLPGSAFNATWWDLVRRYQGVAPPTPRGDEWADALTKTHINDDAAQYYDYALAEALLFQLHDHVARTILEQDPHDTDYYGSVATGDFLRAMMAPGTSRPWRDVLQETTGRELDAQAMVDYFQPLYDWLVEQNQGRTHTLP